MEEENDDDGDFDELLKHRIQETQMLDSPIVESDWLQAEWTLRNAPTAPSLDWTPEHVAQTGLQFVDYPHANAGLHRCFAFLTYECMNVAR
jgi:hypothetical protein